MHRAIWSALALLLATVAFAAGRFSSFRPLPEIVATLPGDESEFSHEFDDRIRERFPIGSSEDKRAVSAGVPLPSLCFGGGANRQMHLVSSSEMSVILHAHCSVRIIRLHGVVSFCETD